MALDSELIGLGSPSRVNILRCAESFAYLINLKHDIFMTCNPVPRIQNGFSWIFRAAVIQRVKVPNEKAHGRKRKSKCIGSISVGLSLSFCHALFTNVCLCWCFFPPLITFRFTHMFACKCLLGSCFSLHEKHWLYLKSIKKLHTFLGNWKKMKFAC